MFSVMESTAFTHQGIFTSQGSVKPLQRKSVKCVEKGLRKMATIAFYKDFTALYFNTYIDEHLILILVSVSPLTSPAFFWYIATWL